MVKQKWSKILGSAQKISVSSDREIKARVIEWSIRKEELARVDDCRS